MKILELFSGTESFSKLARERGHQVFTIENNPEFKPGLCKNILDVTIKDIPFKPDIIWASPPCTCFSVASIGSSWCGNYHPKRTETALGMAYVLKTLELIKKLKPKYFFIENPRGVLRKMAFMDELPIRNTVTYCQYGDTRMKPTDIWTNCSFWKPKPMCKNGDSCHTPAPRGSKTGTQGLKGSKDRSIVPEKLCLEILQCCEQLQNMPSHCGKCKYFKETVFEGEPGYGWGSWKGYCLCDKAPIQKTKSRYNGCEFGMLKTC